MKWKVKPKQYNTDWHRFFVVWPRRTEDGYKVCFEMVWRKYKVFADDGKYVFRVNKAEQKFEL